MLEGIVGAGVDSLPVLVGVLAVLALIDSTSFGTLLIPVWLLMAPGRLRVGRVLAYLAVVAVAYAAIGLALLAALSAFGDGILAGLESAREHTLFLLAQAALAAVLILASLRLDPMTEAGKRRKARRDAERGSAGRVARFRERAVGEAATGGIGPLLALAVAAVGLEAATLLPYLAGISLVAAEDPGLPVAPALILLYCIIMIAPALILLAARAFASRALERPLRAIEAFLSRHANGTIALILFVFGLWLGLGALGDLGVL